MKLVNLTLLLITLMAVSCQTEKNTTKEETKSEIKIEELSSEISEKFEVTSIALSIGKNTIVYLPVFYKHNKIENGFEIIDRETDKLAARFIVNNSVESSGWDEDKLILNLKDGDQGASIYVEDIELSSELIYRNNGKIQRDFSKEIIDGQLVIKNKNQLIDGILVKKFTDAPMLFVPDTILKLSPSKAAMYDYKINDQYYLVKRKAKTEMGSETFDILESLDVSDVSASSFRVETKVQKLENSYSSIEFKISNPSTTKAFVISNPFYTVEFNCRDVGNMNAISSYREDDNTIVAKMIIKSSSKSSCLENETKRLEGFLFVYDVNLNFLKINY